MDHRRTERPLSSVIGRRHIRAAQAHKQMLAMFEIALAQPARFAFWYHLCQQHLQLAFQIGSFGLKLGRRQRRPMRGLRQAQGIVEDRLQLGRPDASQVAVSITACRLRT